MVMEILNQLHKEGHTIILVTHEVKVLPVKLTELLK